MHRQYTTAVTTGLTSTIGLLFIFGISAPTVIFSLLIMLTCLSFFISTMSNLESSIRQPSRIFTIFCVVMLISQIPFMIASGKVGKDFVHYMVIVFGLILSMVTVNLAKVSAVMYRTEGVKPKAGNKIYLVLKRPKSAIDYFVSMTGHPVSSVSFAIGTKWIRFKSKGGCALVGDVSNSHGYTFIDTGLLADSQQIASFNRMINKRWSMTNNCVTSWYEFTYGTFLEHQAPFEIVPSKYVERVLKEVKV